ncbi:hypothetical protein ABFS83_06G085600 [Erythranthe nasuta]
MDYAESKLLDPPETNLSDLPPESFWVPIENEQDWFDRNAVMLQRKTSLKLGFNRTFNSISHRSSDAPKSARPSVFGLPKSQKSSGLDGAPPEKKPGGFLFRSRSEPGGKSMVLLAEPVSPRVSCTGRVRFKTADGRKTRFSRLFSSLFRTRSQKNRET